MKVFKQVLPILLIFLMFISTFSVTLPANAAETEGICGDDLTWSFDPDSGTLTIYGTGDMYDNYGGWYELRKNIKTVIIGSDVTRIGRQAFRGCTNLSKIDIPDTLINIGNLAFLETAFHNDSKNWENNQFCLGNRLIDVKNISSHIIVNQGIEYICDGAFSDNQNITGITIPNGVISIADNAFAHCFIKNITLPDSITGIGRYAFQYCAFLESVNIPEGVTKINWGTFSFCGRLKNIVIPKSITIIEDSAFYSCDNLESVLIPYSVKNIGEDAFSECPNLTITCYKNSYAHQYAEANSIKYTLIQCDHGFTDYEIVEPTCTEDSYKTAYCDNGCGASDTVVIEGSALGHSFTNYEVITELTCTENGSKEAFCENGCGEKDIITEEAQGHTPGEWIVIEEPTYDFEGHKIQNCTVCSEVLNTETIPTLIYEGFPDVWENSWYAEGVEYCFKQGYIMGTDKGIFDPNAELTREQFVVILARVAGAKLSEYSESTFTDVKADSWYGASVIWANENGYVNGIGNGKFGVGQPLTREQLATMFYRYAEKQGLNVEEKAELSYCEDADSISTWALDACAWAIKAELLGSTSENATILSPQMTVTRAQAAKIFMSYDAYTVK